MSSEITIIAIGGNATHPEGTDGTADEQKRISEDIARKLVPLIMKEKRLIITYGNGPVVGKILLRQVLSKEHLEPMPLDICVAHSQGGIAFLLVQAIENALRELEVKRNIATLMTRVLVSKMDPSFSNPTKPIGVFYTEDQAEILSTEYNWCMKEDAGRGWRYFVPSPIPKKVLEINTIKKLLDEESIVVAGGGGGIPVVRDTDGNCEGIPAVIDKDHTSALLGSELGAKTLILLTSIPEVFLHFGTDREEKLIKCSREDLIKYNLQGHFAEGSMKPKIEATIEFLSNGGEQVLITAAETLEDALDGKRGSWFLASTEAQV